MKYLSIIFILFILSCGQEKSSSSEQSTGISQNKVQSHTQLNLTILLDLSDRINPQKNPDKPEHYEKDIALIKYLSEYFVKEMEAKGTYMAKGKMKIIFSPKPEDPNINIAAE